MMQQPTPEQIKNARLAAKMTQKQAAETLYINLKSWQKYESGDRSMYPAFFELFLIKTGQKNLLTNTAIGGIIIPIDQQHASTGRRTK